MVKVIYNIIDFYDINHFIHHKNKYKHVLIQLIQLRRYRNSELFIFSNCYNAYRIAAGLSVLRYSY